MNAKPNSEKHPLPMNSELEAEVHAALRAKGHLFPETEEDVARLEASADLNGIPTPDANKFRTLLRNQTTTNVIPLSDSPLVTCHEIKNDLAMAARNGGPIPQEIRDQMDADRADKETKLKQKKDGLC